jgi:hypothetical protein
VATGNPTAGPGRLLVGGPELVARDRLLQVAVLTGVDGVGGSEENHPSADAPADRLEALVEDCAAQAMESWRQVVNFLFTPDQEQVGLPAPQAAPGDVSGPDLLTPAPAGDPAADDPITDDPGEGAGARKGAAAGHEAAQPQAPEQEAIDPLPSALCLLPSAAWALVHVRGATATERRRRSRRLPETGGGV